MKSRRSFFGMLGAALAESVAAEARPEFYPGVVRALPIQGAALRAFPSPVSNTYNVAITAMDSKSILDNHQAIADAVARALQTASSPCLSNALREESSAGFLSH